MRILTLLIAASLALPLLADQQIEGTYSANTPDGQVQLTLEHSGTGRYQGTLSINGFPLDVRGAIRGDVLQGELNDGGDIYPFEARRLKGQLQLKFAEDDVVVLNDASAAQAGAPGMGAVNVNGRALSAEDIANLNAYGLRMEPGQYWYDPICGAWGIWGGPTAGFIQPGLPVSPLPSHASNGQTGVHINGRNIAWSELNYLQALARGPIQPGQYWLDAMGNAGAVGGPALINFLQAAQQQTSNNAWYGNGSSGWSSADGQSGGVWIANPYGGTGTTVTY